MTRFLYTHEIIDELLKKDNIISKEEKEKMKSLEEEDLIQYKGSIVKELTNYYSLWNVFNQNTFEYKTEKMIIHPTELGYQILIEVWKKLLEE